MQTKLTLSLEQKVIERAKAYAKRQGMSLSKLVQELLAERTQSQPEDEHFEIPEDLQDLCGVVSLPDDFDYKKEKARSLLEKYNKLK